MSKGKERRPAKNGAPRKNRHPQDKRQIDSLANVSLARQPLSFREWLISTPHPERIRHAGIRDYETDGINDLAYEVARDKEFPENGTLFDFVKYLQNLGARREIIEALHCAWWLYRRAGFGGK